ncbi:MAG: hypothetical protein QM589_05050 [Thermomicrobiales bacterium]
MTHDSTRDHDNVTKPASETPSVVPSRTTTPPTAIPIPKPAAPRQDAPASDERHADDPSGAERSTPDKSGVNDPAERGTSAVSWFSKLNIHRNDASSGQETPAPVSTLHDPSRILTDPPASESVPDPGIPEPTAEHGLPPAAAASDGPPVKRIVVVGRQQRPDALREIATILGVPGTAPSTLAWRIVLMGGAVLILLALLANSGGLALTILSAVVPLLLLLSFVDHRNHLLGEATIVLAITGLGGVIVGGILGWIAARVVASSWFDEGVLNFGAAGFGGRYTHAAGDAGWLVWLVNGIVLPIVALAAALALPVALHRSGRFTPAADDGLVLGAAAGAGYAIGTAAVFWSPLNVHTAPALAVADWTLMVIGVAFLQPVIVVLALAALGSAIWRYLSDRQIAPTVLPAVCGIGGILVLRLGSIWIQPRQEHLWLEICWTILVAAGVAVLHRIAVARSPHRT